MTIFRELASTGEGGMTVGEIQQVLDIPASTLSHHLAALVDVRLVVQEREGRTLRCRVERATVTGLQRYLDQHGGGPGRSDRPVSPL